MQNENKTANDNNVSIMEDLTLNQTAAHIKGGPADWFLELDGVKGESENIVRQPRESATTLTR